MRKCSPMPFDVPTLPHDMNTLGMAAHTSDASKMMPMSESDQQMMENPHKRQQHKDKSQMSLNIKRGDLSLMVDLDKNIISTLCLPFYRQPPSKAQYLLLFHNLTDGGSCINGRRYLGNTPTLIAGAGQDPALNTKMRFGLVADNN